MTIILIILSMIVFGLIIDSEQRKEIGKISAIEKIASWWILKMKSNKTSWMIKICLMAVVYFLIRLILSL